MTERKSVLGAKFSLALSVMTLSVPVLYLIGYGYYQGYLDAFGVSTDFFPQSVQDYLVSAFFAFSHAILKTFTIATEKYWIFVIAAIVMAGLGVLIVWVTGDRRQIAIERKKEKFKSHPLALYFVVPASLGVFSLVAPYVIIVMLSFFVVIPYVAYRVGDDEGKAAIDRFQDCTLNEVSRIHNCVYVYRDDELQAKGLLIARSSDHIAIFDQGRAIILPSDNSRVVVIGRGKEKVNK